MPFGLGFFATAGAGAGAAGSFDLLETQVLGSSTASVTFSSLSTYASTYQHLQIRATPRTVNSGAVADIWGYVNGDTATNYSYHFMRGVNNSGVSSGFGNAYGGMYLGQGNKANTTNGHGALVVDILDPFETTKFTTFRGLSGATSSPDSIVSLTSGLWRNTASLTSITLYSLGDGNLAANSRFSLYGLKAA
jgi:hypothetical protein